MLCENHVYPTLPASDLERARRFYEGVLGFEPTLVTPAGILYDARGSRLFVYPTPFAGTNQATACGFEIDDLPAMVKELKGRGVRFEEYDMPQVRTDGGIAHSDQGDAAWFRDSEGNILGLFSPVRSIPWPGNQVSSGARV